ncbi:MAG: BON domain-containing protein [Verrucomicrobiia bacterium]|jgi:osmotically-inducible protein OsmY
MRDFFIGLIVGAALTAATGWYFMVARKSQSVQHAQDVTAATLQRGADAIEAKLVAWHLTTTDIQEELAKTGKVVRRQMGDFGAAVADASADAAITAKIKAKFALDRDLSALSISVNTTAGHVTLAGTVPSHKLIGKAVMLALETDGVREVSSMLQVKGRQKG